MKRTYKFTEIAGKIGKTREIVRGWSNYYREFLPTKAFGGSQRYTEEAIEIFEIISKLSDANKPPRFIKEYLQEMRQKAIIALNDEKPLLPTVDNSILPPVMNNSSLQLSKETMELSNRVQLLTQKIEANKSPKNLKDYADDLNQKVGISSTAGGRLLSPIMDHSNSQFVQLSNEVEELSNFIHTLKQRVIEVSNVSEEVTELRNVIQILTHHVADLFEQDIRSEVATTLELLQREIEGVSVEVIGLKNVIQTIQQKVIEVSEKDLKGEILTATTELLNQRYEGVSEDVKNLHNGIRFHTQKVMELQNVIQTIQQKVIEASEKDLKGEILTATTELLNQRYEGVSKDVKNLRNEIYLKAQKVTELQNVIQTVQQKVIEVSEQDLRGEIITATTELLNQRYEGVSEDVKNLNNGIRFHTLKVAELQNVIQTIQQKVIEVSEKDLKGEILTATTELLNQRYEGVSKDVKNLRNEIQLHTQKVSERLEQELRSKVNATAESLDKRYGTISEEVTVLRNVIGTVQQKVTEVSERDPKGEIITATTELLNQRYECVSEDVKNLRNEIQLRTQKVSERLEQEIRNEVKATAESLDKRYGTISEEVTVLRNVIGTVQQKVTEVSERDPKGEIITATTELLNQRYEGISEDVKNLRNEIQLHTQKVSKRLEQEIRNEVKSLDKRYGTISEEVTELRNVIGTVQQKVTEVSEQDPTQKVNEMLEQEIRSEMLATAESLNKRYDDISQQLTSQQRLLEKISKMLGF